jgi:hypothetical protein
MEAGGLLNLSKLYRSERKNIQAEVAINYGIEVVRRVEESYDLPSFIAEKAEVEIALGRPKAADALYDQATRLIEGLLVNAPSSRVKSSMIGSMSEIYLGHFRLAWNQLHDGSKAFEIIERARGRALLGTLGSTQASDGRIDKSPAELQIARLQSTLLHSRLSPNETKRVLAELDRAYDSAFSLQNENRQTPPVTLSALRRQLAHGETLVEYVLDNKTSYAMEVTASRFDIQPLPARSEVDKLTKKFLSAIKSNADFTSPGKALYDSLIPESIRKETTSLIVVADGSLHSIPFGALVDGRGNYLSQSVAVSSAPSASVYAKLKTTATTLAATKPFLGVAFSPETTEPQLAAST